MLGSDHKKEISVLSKKNEECGHWDQGLRPAPHPQPRPHLHLLEGWGAPGHSLGEGRSSGRGLAYLLGLPPQDQFLLPLLGLQGSDLKLRVQKRAHRLRAGPARRGSPASRPHLLI